MLLKGKNILILFEVYFQDHKNVFFFKYTFGYTLKWKKKFIYYKVETLIFNPKLISKFIESFFSYPIICKRIYVRIYPPGQGGNIHRHEGKWCLFSRDVWFLKKHVEVRVALKFKYRLFNV